MIVRFHPLAEADVLEARRRYRGFSPALEARFMRALENKLGDVVEWPDADPRVHRDVRRARLERFPYWVLHTVRGNTLVVLAVPHVARDASHWIRRRPPGE